MPSPSRAGLLASLTLLIACSSGAPQNAGLVEVQEHLDWLKANATPLLNTTPGNPDFSDLMPLKAAIGDARIVLLGEQSHGDGLIFLIKTRLIEFLHKEIGFRCPGLRDRALRHGQVLAIDDSG